MRKQLLLISLTLLTVASVQAQDKWDLRRVVEYALANNISVKQADLRIRFAELDLLQKRHPFSTGKALCNL